MCGIAGWYSRRNTEVHFNIIKAQCDTIVHRGPDDHGVLIDGDFGFGMRRLSIIDLGGGHQPITSADGSHSVVFNGEIYNYRALRADLESLGHNFRTRSDTEVILQGFMEWGHRIWPKLEGMYAVALWNHRARTLYLVRDPLGIKPLYYTVQNGGLAFGSEIKALAPVPDLSYTPDSVSVDCYFAFGHVLADDTIYREVKKVEPGCCMTFTAGGDTKLGRFWNLKFNVDEAPSESEWLEALRRQLLAAVESHLVADVPCGAFLSGGIDSSAIVAAMAQVTGGAVHTYTIGFNDSRYDESRYAAQIAAHLGCKHTAASIEVDEASKILPVLASCFDEPFADSSAIPTWYVSRLAAADVKVSLAGDGGDELFAGYTRHKSEKLISYYERLPGPVRRLGGMVGALPPLPLGRWNYARQRLQKLYADACLPNTYSRFFAKNQITSAALRAAVYQSSFLDALDLENEYIRLERRLLPSFISEDPVQRFLYADTVVRLPNAMLTKVDRTSMFHSLEVRVPFLSHTFVDWAATMPVSLKLKGLTSKYPLRKVIEPWMPEGIHNRPKQGFSVPLAGWFKGGLGPYARQLWEESGIADAGYLDRAAIDGLFREHQRGRADHSGFLYALAMFSLWWADCYQALRLKQAA